MTTSSPADPGATPTAARALLGEDHARLLHGLVEADLLHDHGRHRYTFHDAVRTWLHTRATRDLGAEERADAQTRLLAAYRDTTTAADLVLNPWRWRVATEVAKDVKARQAQSDPWFADATQALAWLDQEFTAIRTLAARAHETGAYTTCWQTAEALKFYFTARRPYAAWEEITDTALDAAQSAGETAGQAQMLLLRASLETNRHRFLTARAHLRAAMPLWQRLDHASGIASTLEGLGITYLAQEDDLAAAVDLLEQSLTAHEAIGRARGIALQQRNLAAAYRKTGRITEARTLLEETLTVFADAGDTYQTGRSQRHLAEVHLTAGDPDQAEQAARAALAAAERMDVGYEIGGIHVLVADIAHHRGDSAAERECLAAALPLYETISAPDTEPTRRRLADLGPNE